MLVLRAFSGALNIWGKSSRRVWLGVIVCGPLSCTPSFFLGRVLSKLPEPWGLGSRDTSERICRPARCFKVLIRFAADASYEGERKMVTMFSGCRDDQTSADANIGGMSEGAMSWAFLETMKRIPNPTYLQVSARLHYRIVGTLWQKEHKLTMAIGFDRHEILFETIKLYSGSSIEYWSADWSWATTCSLIDSTKKLAHRVTKRT